MRHGHRARLPLTHSGGLPSLVPGRRLWAPRGVRRPWPPVPVQGVLVSRLNRSGANPEPPCFSQTTSWLSFQPANASRRSRNIRSEPKHRANGSPSSPHPASHPASGPTRARSHHRAGRPRYSPPLCRARARPHDSRRARALRGRLSSGSRHAEPPQCPEFPPARLEPGQAKRRSHDGGAGRKVPLASDLARIFPVQRDNGRKSPGVAQEILAAPAPSAQYRINRSTSAGCSASPELAIVTPSRFQGATSALTCVTFADVLPPQELPLLGRGPRSGILLCLAAPGTIGMGGPAYLAPAAVPVTRGAVAEARGIPAHGSVDLPCGTRPMRTAARSALRGSAVAASS